MFTLKTRRTYQSPFTKIAEVDLEGLVCLSPNVQVKELENMNNPDDPLEGIGEAAGEAFYLES